MIKSIPLNKLVPSPRNVRRTGDAAADLQLKADIEARGLLQNLLVTAAKPRGCFAVEAGGRRLAALQALAEEGKLAADHEVCCLVLDDSSAQEASLAENFQRLSMNPADECQAFSALVAEGADPEDIARRFGLTVRFVEGRLRLAGLAPVVFAALGAGEITLDIAQAFAATPDQERQAHVFEQMTNSYGGYHPDSIRRMMTQATIAASDRRALYVGEEAYLAAGGRTERDLFSDRSETRWLDIAIVERLAAEKLEAEAARLSGELGYAFVRPTLGNWLGHEQLRGLERLPVQPVDLSEEEQASVAVLEAEIDDLSDRLEDEDIAAADRSETEEKVRELNGRIEAIVDRPPVLDDAVRPHVGAFLMLDGAGRPRLDPGLYVERPDEDAVQDEDDPDVTVDRNVAAPAKAAGLSQRLVDELAMQRRDILAVHVAADPGLALDLAIFLMVDGEAGYRSEKTGSSLSATPPGNPVIDFRTPDAAATIARAEAGEALDRSWTGGETRGERFDAFRALAEDERAAWLGFAVARTLEASLFLPGDRSCAFHDHLGRLIGIDVARWWRPTGANFFDRVPKSVTLAALEAVGGAQLASRYAKAKKAELAQACERIFAGDFLAEVEVKQAALDWLPAEMRFAPVEIAIEPAAGNGAEAPAHEPVEDVA